MINVGAHGFKKFTQQSIVVVSGAQGGPFGFGAQTTTKVARKLQVAVKC